MYKMVKVDSSAISEVGYNKDDNTLKIVFNSGAEYEYLDIPESQYKEFVKAPSIGKYYNTKIRLNFKAK